LPTTFLPKVSLASLPQQQTLEKTNSCPLQSTQLEQSDILLYTSISDNLPNFLLEAQAAGNSIVAFARGGIPECFIPNVSGFLVEESEEEIATALLRILVSKKIRLDMSNAARQFIEQKNSFFTVGKEYSSLYEKIVARS
jgi:glycosyltransferase involved in cell wall biosynthesis